MISVLKNRLSAGTPPPIPNGSTKGDTQSNHQDGSLHPPPTQHLGKRSPSRTRKRAIDQAPYQESVAARELRIFYNRNKLCNSFKKVLSSSAGLFIVLLLYICLGAILFQKLESNGEQTERENLSQQRKEFAVTFSQCYINETVDKDCIEKNLEMYEKSMMPFYLLVLFEETWTFMNSFYFCFTTISTIGYGTITPHTGLGRFICVPYAIVGIPLMLLFIADVGTALARWAKICAIAIKQRRNSRTFKEAAKASLRKHLKPHKNESPPESTNIEETTAQTQTPDLAPETQATSPSPTIDDLTKLPNGEFWVKMHVPKKRSWSMTTQDSQSCEDHSDVPSEEDVSDDCTSGSSDSESRDEESVDKLKLVDCSSIVVQIDPESDIDRSKSTDDDCFDENGNQTDILHPLKKEDSLESPTEVLVNPGASLDSPVDQVCHAVQTDSDRQNVENMNEVVDTSLPMKRQSSRVNFSDVIDLQSGKRTSLEDHKGHKNTSTDDEATKLGIIENPMVQETDEEGEADKLLKPTGFPFSSAPRRNAVFIPGSDTSPSDPPTSPDMRSVQGGESSSSRRRSSITRRMGMAFGSISAVSDREVAHFSFPAWLALLLLIIYIVFGAWIVHLFEEWGFIDSFYFSFISLSTIGYGDLTPRQRHSEIFTFLYTFLGLCFTSMCMSLSSKELTRLLKKLAWKVGYYKSRQWKGSVRAFVKDKKRRIHERSEHWRGSRRQKNRKRKRPSAHRTSERSSLKSLNSPCTEQVQNHVGL